MIHLCASCRGPEPEDVKNPLPLRCLPSPGRWALPSLGLQSVARLPLITCLGLLLGISLRAHAQPNVTSYARMTEQLHSDAACSSLLRLTSLGKAAGDHKNLWLVRAADPASDPAQTIRILVLCRQHGDEPASTEALLGLLHRLAQGGDPALRQSLSRVTLYVVPMVNPDGADVDARSNAVGADLNRDWGVFHQPETQEVARAARLIRPNLVIDAHNWDGNDEYNADCLEVSREMATPLGKAAHALQQAEVRDLADSGYAVHPTAWGADTDPRLAHRWFSHQNVLSALVETHSGDPSDAADFQRRQGMYAALLHGMIRHYAADYGTEKPRLEAWEGDPAVHDAELFPAVPSVKSQPRLASRHSPPRVWLWVLAAYGLTLWGAATGRGAASDGPARRKAKRTGYYAYRPRRPRLTA